MVNVSLKILKMEEAEVHLSVSVFKISLQVMIIVQVIAVLVVKAVKVGEARMMVRLRVVPTTVPILVGGLS